MSEIPPRSARHGKGGDGPGGHSSPLARLSDHRTGAARFHHLRENQVALHHPPNAGSAAAVPRRWRDGGDWRCPAWIRTTTNRVKVCCATLTPPGSGRSHRVLRAQSRSRVEAIGNRARRSCRSSIVLLLCFSAIVDLQIAWSVAACGKPLSMSAWQKRPWPAAAGCLATQIRPFPWPDRRVILTVRAEEKPAAVPSADRHEYLGIEAGSRRHPGLSLGRRAAVLHRKREGLESATGAPDPRT